MHAKFFTPQELAQMEREDSLCLLEAAQMQVSQMQARSQQLTTLREQMKALQARVTELEKLLEEAQRAAKRQAAPFRVPEARRVQMPKPPGRPAGHPGSFRPRPARVDEEITVELSTCPKCGGRDWRNPQELEQYIEELPVTRPRVTRLRTYEATCACCGELAASTHPMQVSRATGAAGTHLGPRALALAADLNKAKHLPMRKTCAVLRDHFGLVLSPGGLSQALARTAAKLEPQYFQLQKELCQAPVVHVDETSWWVAGASAWLWVFTHGLGTFYFLCQSRGREVVDAVLGLPFNGVLVSDCLSTYDIEEGLQQKCYAHHLKATRQALEAVPASAQTSASFLPQVEALLRQALALGRTREQTLLSAQEYACGCQRLRSAADTLLDQSCGHPLEEAVRKRLHRQRDHLFTFLEQPGVDATNNLAERQLRPAVIARKLSCGNKTIAGTQTFQILASVAATCTQTKTSFIDCVATAVPLNSS